MALKILMLRKRLTDEEKNNACFNDNTFIVIA